MVDVYLGGTCSFGSLKCLGGLREGHRSVLICIAVHLLDEYFSSVCTVMQWFVPSWAWSRAEKRLDDLFPDIDMRTTVLFSLLKLPVEQRIEFFEESNENTIGLLKYLSGLGAHIHCVVPVLVFWDLVPCNASRACIL